MIRVRRSRLHLLVMPLSAMGSFWAELRRHRPKATNIEDRPTRKHDQLKCVVNYEVFLTLENLFLVLEFRIANIPNCLHSGMVTSLYPGTECLRTYI